MFEKFGEFDSVLELNQKAKDLLYAGEEKQLYELAAENGLDKEDVDDYLDEVTPELATASMAAFGKLKVEADELKPYEIMEDWLQYIKVQITENAGLAAAIRKKGKSLKGCIAALLKWSLQNHKPVDADVLKACGISYKVTLGIPGMGRAKKIIMDYYMG